MDDDLDGKHLWEGNTKVGNQTSSRPRVYSLVHSFPSTGTCAGVGGPVTTVSVRLSSYTGAHVSLFRGTFVCSENPLFVLENDG